MVEWMVASTGLGINEAAMLLSLAGDLRICQIVDPLMTTRMEVPKSVLAALGITLSEPGACARRTIGKEAGHLPTL